jgi:predicted unusual protein kinase regulating ubiquinone biosynthesis (AarF/ABC1/UbiB family)
MPKDKSDLDGVARGLGRRLWATSRVATAAAHLAARRLLGARGAQDGLIGESLAHELDQMKGMAMKVGQILSYFEGILPPETHAALRRLQQGSRPIAFPVMLQVIEQAFGQQLQTLFDRFDRTPVASASIGQVYRAELRGAPVAVKVQYPGIRETMDGDFSRLGWIAKIASAATAVDGSALAAELRARVGEECDYEREATYGNAFAAAFSADPAVSIPRAIPDRTRPTVLTPNGPKAKVSTSSLDVQMSPAGTRPPQRSCASPTVPSSSLPLSTPIPTRATTSSLPMGGLCSSTSGAFGPSIGVSSKRSDDWPGS